MKKMTREKRFAIAIFIIGFIMMFLIPTWQIPDEYTHLQLIGSSISNEDFAFNLEESIGIERTRVEQVYAEKMDFGEVKKAMFKAPTYTRLEMMPKKISLSVIKHLPMTLGLFVGIILGLPSFWVLQLGELFALLFYTFLCYEGLKLLPFKKEMMFMTMLIPEMMQQAGGLGYDAVLLPTCMIYICYIMYLKFGKETINLRDLIFSVLTPLFICYLKMPYIFLGFLVFILPLNKIHISIGKITIDEGVIKKWRIPLFITCLILIGLAVYLLRSNHRIQLVIGLFTEWKRTLYLLIQTVKTWGSFLFVSSVGNFGWLDTPTPIFFCVIVYISLFVISFCNSDKINEFPFRKWDVSIILLALLILILFTSIAMTEHTIKTILFGAESAPNTYVIQDALYQIPYIGGLQGRYYLPFISLIFFLIPQVKCIKNNSLKYGIFAFEILVYMYVFYILLARYWIL